MQQVYDYSFSFAISYILESTSKCFNNIKISNMIIRYFEPLVAKSLIANNERDRGSFFDNDLDLGSGQTERGISKRREKMK